jgi:prepilin-type N-terminal cleavage/methylation domain-containing protein
VYNCYGDITPAQKVSKHKKHHKKVGFSLVELLVVVAVIAVLAAAIGTFLNPLGQFKKARDSQRASDLRNIQTNVEAYFVDVGSYPLSTSSPNFEITGAPWGQPWPGYMPTVPKDPLDSQQYVYASDGTSYQIYAKFESSPVDPAFACEDPCGPDGQYNAAVVSTGSEAVAFEPPPPPGGGEPGGGSPSPGASPTPSPTPEPLPPGDQTYFVSGSSNPRITQVDFSPLDVAVGANQTVTVRVRDPNPIDSVSVTIQSDNQSNTYPLSQVSSVFVAGQYREVWSGSWISPDTHDYIYYVPVEATSASGTSRVGITIR